ncbi:MAG: DUF2007 domain-containing protein [Planctomycetales bacterium]
MEIDPQAPVTVASFPNEMEAGALVAALEVEGIKAMAVGDLVSGFRIEIPGLVHVVVRNEDLGKAQEVYREIQQHAEPVDWSTVDVGDETDPSAE